MRVKFLIRYLAELVRVKFKVPRGTREGEIFHEVPRGVKIYVPRRTRDSEIFH